MNWIIPFLKIRWLQTQRAFAETGITGMILALAILVGFLYWWSEKLLGSPAILVLPALALTSIHFSRSDHRFLQIHFPKQKHVLLSVEYLFFTSPFFLSGCYFQPIWTSLLLLLALLLPFAPIISLAKTPVKLPFIHLIPVRFFEWKANLRENPWIWLLVFLMPFFVFVHIGFPIASWVLELLAISGLYKQNEDWQFITLNNSTASTFLYEKFKLHFSCLLLFNVPAIALFVVLSPGLVWIPLVFIILLFFHIAYNLVCKYAFFEPNQQMAPNQIWLGIGILALFIPPLLALPFFMGLRFYFRSLSNLYPYFNA